MPCRRSVPNPSTPQNPKPDTSPDETKSEANPTDAKPEPNSNDAKREANPTDAKPDQSPDDHDSGQTIIVTVSGGAATYGQTSVKLSATVTSGKTTGVPVNEGFVTFAIATGTDRIGRSVSQAVSGSGATVMLPLSGLAAGRYNIQATYEPAPTVDKSRFRSVAGAAVLSIAQARTTLTVRSSLNPARPGQGTPSGQVIFFLDDAPLGSAAPGVVDGQIVWTLTTSEMPAGVHTITAVYSGDRDFLGSDNRNSPSIQTVARR